MVVAPYSPSAARAASAPRPARTAAGSPSRRAMVSSSAVVLRTDPSAWSTRTRTVLTTLCSLALVEGWSDELGAGEEPHELAPAVAVVGHDLPGLTRRPRANGVHGTPGGTQADARGVDR